MRVFNLQNTVLPCRVALVSDTHGHLDDRIGEVVARCDLAVHAGDVGSAAALAAMRPRSGEVLAVAGNNDVAQKWPDGEEGLLATLPAELCLQLPGGELVVVHGHRHGGARERHARLRRSFPGARAVVYGHSHRQLCDTGDAPWVLNPGAAGRARTYGGPACLVLHVEAQAWRVEPMRFAPGARARRAKGG